MRVADFDLYRDLLKKHSGLNLTPDKSYLIDSRLTPVARKWGYNSLDAMTITLRGVPDPKLIRDVIEAMTTNETSFFRDVRPFDIFRDTVLPYLIEQRRRTRKIRIWSAACSSGQEPYSLSMILKDRDKELSNFNMEILATDISGAILAQAEAARYSQFEIQRGLPIQVLIKYFEQKENGWKLKDDIRKLVRFQQFNLLDSMDHLGTFDVIFCRNVLTYFNEQMKADVLNRLAKRLAPDGVLYLGGAETVLGITEAFVPVPGFRGLYAHKNAKLKLGEETVKTGFRLFGKS